MHKRSLFRNKLIFILLFLAFVIIAAAVSLSFVYYVRPKNNMQDFIGENDRDYHIVILGTYENQLFLQQIYEGARKYSNRYDAVVELYVPNSKAQDVPLQQLLDYATFVNADGIIAYIDSADEVLPNFYRINDTSIPLVTTGQYASGVKQISFIGNNYWELGNTIGNEAVSVLGKKGMAFIISSEYSSNSTYSNMTNSIQAKLKNYAEIEYEVVDQEKLFSELGDIIHKVGDYISKEENVIFVCLNEEDTIKTAQILTEKNILSDKFVNLIGFGNNETCQTYFNKGTITELISLDPISIGEAAVSELFEYRNKGYANSYIAADVIIQRRAQ